MTNFEQSGNSEDFEPWTDEERELTSRLLQRLTVDEQRETVEFEEPEHPTQDGSLAQEALDIFANKIEELCGNVKPRESSITHHDTALGQEELPARMLDVYLIPQPDGDIIKIENEYNIDSAETTRRISITDYSPNKYLPLIEYSQSYSLNEHAMEISVPIAGSTLRNESPDSAQLVIEQVHNVIFPQVSTTSL